MQPEHLALMAEGFRQFGGAAGAAAAGAPDVLQRVGRYLGLVAEWNEKINLTAIKSEREMVVKHAVDSATLLGAVEVKPGMRVLDVGTGAGFPGVVIQLLVPGARVALLDTVQKKCRFLEHVRETLGLENLSVHWGRAEDLGHQPALRAQFDLVVARAVAELRVLAELCLPFCRVGGRFVAMKGPGGPEEASAAAPALELLGARVERQLGVSLPESAGERTLIICRKDRATPPAYPRKAGIPARKPLERK